MIHQEQPIGNQLVCTDGVFASALKMSGPVDSKKPYLIFGNSIAIDFTSSGHAKDAQSFGRYGFRFGVRPVFVDKVKYNSHSKEQIHKVFKCVSNYAKYVNTLKFLTVSTSTSIERLLHLEKEHNEATIDSILNGKIFKQGFEDNGHQYVKTEKDAEQIVDTFFRESSHGEEDREIIKSIHKSCRRERGNQCKPVLRPSPDLWDMRGIPNHIQIYLEQIKEFRGDFIEVFKEAREHAKPTGTYAHIMRKPNFIN